MASGDTLFVYTAQHGIATGSAIATQGLRNSHPTVEFNADTEAAIYFEDVLARNYAGGGITLTLHWMAASATTGDTVWGGAFERHLAGTDDLDADSFGAEATISGTANGTSGVLTATAISFANGAAIDSLAVGDSFRLRINRKAVLAVDSMTGNAQLLKVEGKET
jgi:hypothetical protein